MASVDVSQLSAQEKDELVCSYAALLLHDGEQEITVSIRDKAARLNQTSPEMRAFLMMIKLRIPNHRFIIG